jgi:photosystem II stability/assembly factor-like uncharacterized protein
MIQTHEKDLAMFATSSKYTKMLFALAAALLAMTSHAQDPSSEICAGTDAVAGTVNGIVEAGTRVFALTSDSGDHPDGGGLYISCNGGDAWYRHPSIPGGGIALAADPADPHTIYAGIGGGFVYVSRDAGETWVSSRPVEFSNMPVNAIAALPDGQVYVGMYTGGLLHSSDYGSSWRSLEAARPSDTIRTVLVDPGNTGRILVIVGDDGIYQSLDGGQSFEKSTLAGLSMPPVYWDVRDIAFAPSNASHVYAGGPAGLRESVDGGYTFSALPGADDVDQITFGRRDTETMFLVSEHAGVLRSADGGQSFTLLEPELPRSTDWVRCVLQLESGRLLVGSALEGMFKSDDDGATWQSAGSPAPTPPIPPPPPPPPPPPEVTARLAVSIENLNGSERIEIGTDARFRIVVRNDGPDVSTDTFVHVNWRLPGTNGAPSKGFSLTSGSGSCVVTPDASSGCTIGTLGVGGSATIEFSGATSTSYYGEHRINAVAMNAEHAEVRTSDSVGTTRTIGGGGSAGIPLLVALLLIAAMRPRYAKHVQNGQNMRNTLYPTGAIFCERDTLRVIERPTE